MRGKKLLAAFLLGVYLCFIPALGYGKVRMRPSEGTVGEFLVYGKEPWWDYVGGINSDISLVSLGVQLLNARINYIMRNPTSFQYINILYDPDGKFGKSFPEGVDTKGKICIEIWDIRGYFSDESGIRLLEAFKRYLEVIYGYVDHVTTDMNTDVVGKFWSKGDIPLGYFYQGEYHLWGEWK